MVSVRAYRLIVLLIYLACGPLAEVAHVDGLAGGRGPAAVAPSDTTAKNAITADGRHECLACTVSQHRLSVPQVPAWTTAGPAPHVSISLTAVTHNRSIFCRLLPTKRGPPVAERV